MTDQQQPKTGPCGECRHYRNPKDAQYPFCNWEPADKTSCPTALRYYGIALLSNDIDDCPCHEPKEDDNEPI